MSPNRPVNRFRTQSPPKPTPSVTASRLTKPKRRFAGFGQSVGNWWTSWQSQPLLQRIYGLIIRILLGFLLGTFGWVIVLKWVPVWVTPLVVSRWLDTFGTNESSKVYKNWRSLDSLSPEAALAVISSEDQHFPTHWGFDFDEIQDAIEDNKTRKRPRGASTISQQVAKNVFLWNGRSYIRKGLEVYFTVLIELIWGKHRILEVYLNVAETGPMTFGVEAASRRFYGHSAKSLSRDEAARIAAVLPNPRQFSIEHPSSYIQRRTRFIARQMRRLGGQRYLKNL
jgi:monofunctional glycosyltransferase